MGAGMLGTRGSVRQGNRHRPGPAALLVPAASDNVRARMFRSRDPRRQRRLGGRGAGPRGTARRSGWRLPLLLAAATFAPGFDPATGLALPAAKASDLTHPFAWPPGPGAFAGVGADVGGDRFSLAFATYLPYADRTTYQHGDRQEHSSRY